MGERTDRLNRLLVGSIPQKFLFIYVMFCIVAVSANILDLLIRSPDDIVYALRASLTVTVIVLIVEGLIMIYFSKVIADPIRKLQELARVFEDMNYEKRVQINTGDEFQELADTLNSTLDVLEFVKAEHEQMDKAKTEFLSITSHELRSPMTPMKAQLQMLQQGYFGKLNKKQRDSVNMVLRNTIRLDNIIADLLEVSRIESSRLKFVFVKSNLRKAIDSLMLEMKSFHPDKKIAIIQKIGKLPVFEVDPDRVMQVLRNLVNNAIKFAPPKSRVWVNVVPEGDHILFTVKDEGPGIPASELQNVFMPFYQLETTWNRRHEGTGLGLTICKGIVEAQKGRIWVESGDGKGATFLFTVPLKPVKVKERITNAFLPPKKLQAPPSRPRKPIRK